MIDVKVVEGVLKQAISLASLGSGVLASVTSLVGNVISAMKQRGYELDTAELDELIADASRRQKIAEQEANAQE
jgi:hypothetical protein